MRWLTCAVLSALGLVGCGSNGTGGAGGSTSTATSAASTGDASTASAGGSTTSTSTATSATSTATAGSTSSATSSSTGAGGGPQGGGDCTTDADCPVSKCVELTPGGFKVCNDVFQSATMCNQPMFDECCGASKVCPGGATCYLGPLVPSCGGAQQLAYNECAKDACASDAECSAGSICAPAAVLGRKVRACLTANCTTDADCAPGGPGGVCAPVEDPCCGTAAGLYCVYPNGCRKNADCGVDYCVLDPANLSPKCTSEPPQCPL